MADQPTKQTTPDNPEHLIDFSDVAKTDRPDAPSLTQERAERDRDRLDENDASATAAKDRPDPIIATPD